MMLVDIEKAHSAEMVKNNDKCEFLRPNRNFWVSANSDKNWPKWDSVGFWRTFRGPTTGPSHWPKFDWNQGLAVSGLKSLQERREVQGKKCMRQNAYTLLLTAATLHFRIKLVVVLVVYLKF